MKPREYELLKAQILAEYQTKVAALELVWKISGKGMASAAHNTGRGAVLQAVKSAVLIMHGPFKAETIEKQIKDTNAVLGAKIKRASVSNALKKLVGKTIEVVEQGIGRQGTTYKKKTG